METILVHENDMTTLEVVAAALEMEGYQVHHLTDDHDNTLEMIRRYQPGLLLIDCWRIDRSGRHLTYWIKTQFPHLPLIAFSCDNQIDQHYHDLGFDDYLKKPFDLDVFYKVIRKFLPCKRDHQF
jgi:DNA-binding response OmpR family regulator